MMTWKIFSIGLLLFTIVISSASATSIYIQPAKMILRDNKCLDTQKITIKNTNDFPIYLDVTKDIHPYLEFKSMTHLPIQLEVNESMEYFFYFRPVYSGNYSNSLTFIVMPMVENPELTVSVQIDCLLEGGTPSPVPTTTIEEITTTESATQNDISTTTTTISGITATLVMNPTNETSTTTTTMTKEEIIKKTIEGHRFLSFVEDYFLIILVIAIVVGAIIGITLKRRKGSNNQ